ncbi:hypothetical protein [Spirosoma endophyticum]|nr:hypothetical protein [Spirosoma endophyticum]
MVASYLTRQGTADDRLTIRGYGGAVHW